MQRTPLKVGHSAPVTSVAVSPDTKRIVSGSRDKCVKIWDVETAAEVSKFYASAFSVGASRGSEVLCLGSFLG